MNGNVSEVARLTAQIAAEYASCYQGLHGLAESARHEVIHARMQRLEVARVALVEQVGEEKAEGLIVAALEGAS